MANIKIKLVKSTNKQGKRVREGYNQSSGLEEDRSDC